MARFSPSLVAAWTAQRFLRWRDPMINWSLFILRHLLHKSYNRNTAMPTWKCNFCCSWFKERKGWRKKLAADIHLSKRTSKLRKYIQINDTWYMHRWTGSLDSHPCVKNRVSFSFCLWFNSVLFRVINIYIFLSIGMHRWRLGSPNAFKEVQCHKMVWLFLFGDHKRT